LSVLTALARAQAAEAGRAQPLTTVRHVHISDRPLVLVPLVLAGEAAAPLAALVGDDEAEPRLLFVPNPRNRTQRFEFVAELAGVVLASVNRRTRTVEPNPGRGGAKMRYADAPQLLVPNPGGLEFVRLLGRSTRFRRTYGQFAVHRSVPLLGQWLTFFRDRTDHAGSALLLAMTEVLSAHWATGQSGLEDANLAALLGWIEPADGLDGPSSAALAEDPLLWPPAGPSTDPSFDNEILAPSLASGNERSLATALPSQLEPTWRLMWRAIRLLRALPEGASVPVRWAADRDAFTAYQASIVDGAALPQPRVDSAVAAAGRLDRLEREQARYDAQRALDDPLVMAEFRLAGVAFAGTVVAAQPQRRDTSGRRPVLRPHITVETTDPVQVDPGASVVCPARPAQTATVVEVSLPLVVLELSGGMGRTLSAPAGAVPEAGEAVTYGPATDAYQPPGRFPSRDATPWTHGGPPAEYVPADTDAGEEWA
jgi:hypothetical protein